MYNVFCDCVYMIIIIILHVCIQSKLKKKNPFRPQQMCIIDGAVRVGTDGEIGNLMAIVGQLLLCLPWVSVLLTPFYLAARHYRHLPSSKVPYLPFLYKQTDNTHKHRRERRGNFRRNKRTDHKAKSRKEKGTSHLYKNLPHTHRERNSIINELSLQRRMATFRV